MNKKEIERSKDCRSRSKTLHISLFVLGLFFSYGLITCSPSIQAIDPIEVTETIEVADSWSYGSNTRTANYADYYISHGALSASYSTGATPDIYRGIMQFNLSSIPEGAEITDVRINMYVYDHNNYDNVYVTESDATDLTLLTNFALSHYGTILYDWNPPDTNTGWDNLTFASHAYFDDKDEVFIGLIIQNDYDNAGSATWNYYNIYGVNDATRKPSLTITYTYIPGWPPEITSTPEGYGNISQEYRYEPKANETVVWQFLEYPDGTNITGDVISWYPNATGNFDFRISCNNSYGGFDYQNWTVTIFPSWLGGETISDEFLGYIILLLLVTGMNIYGLKISSGLLQVFAFIGLLVALPMVWLGTDIGNAIMLVAVLGNLAILIKGWL